MGLGIQRGLLYGGIGISRTQSNFFYNDDTQHMLLCHMRTKLTELTSVCVRFLILIALYSISVWLYTCISETTP
jgi:hypothetical protein